MRDGPEVPGRAWPRGRFVRHPRRLPSRLVVAMVLLLSTGAATGCSVGPVTPVTPRDPVGAGPSATVPADRVGSQPDDVPERTAAVSALMARRAAAVGTRDKRAWLATLADPSGAFATAQSSLFDRMARLPVGRYGEQGVQAGPPLDETQRQRYGDDAWVASVRIGYQLTGFDRGLRTVDTSFVVTRVPAGWRLAGVADPGDAQPWDLSPLTVVRSPSTLVVGNAPESTLRGYLALADAAHARIAAVWGTAVPAVVVAPRDAADLVEQLHRTADAGLDQVAAVTDGPLEAGHVAAGDRVYVNPTAFAGLSEAGRRVVITHELTHVTVRATTTRPVPMWLSEGFADQVGYATVSLPSTTVAALLLAQVRAGTGPRRLPVDADFDPARGVIGPVYGSAWLAVTRMAARYGEPRVVDLYLAAAGGSSTDGEASADPSRRTARAFPLVLGVTEQAFTADWLAYLTDLAR